MTDQQFRERMKNAIDQTLSGLPEDSFLYQRVEAALEEGENNLNKRLLPKTFSIMAAIILITLTTALASGLFSNVNWFGEVIPDEYQGLTPSPRPVETPKPSGVSSADLFELSQEILLNRNERELVVVYDGNSASWWAGMEMDILSLETFCDCMQATSSLPVPQNIPEGYEFYKGFLMLDCLPEGQYKLLSTESPIEGLIIERYTADEDFVSAYELLFRRSDDAEDYLSIYVNYEFETDPSEHSFGLNPDQKSRSVIVKGMDNALAILSGSHASIRMRRALETPVHFLVFAPNGHSFIDTYTEVHVDITARQIAVEELCSIFDAP